MQTSLITGKKNTSHDLGNAYSRHMTSEKSIFQSLSHMSGGVVTFEGNQKGMITCVGKVCVPPYPYIDNVLLVKGLKHNLLRISQLCDSGYNVTFNKDVYCSEQGQLFTLLC